MVIDDHPVVRDGLRSMLVDPGVEVVGEAGSATDAVGQIHELIADVVLLDMALPDADGVTTLKRLKAVRPQARILVLTMHDNPALVREAVRAGASGYLLKGVNRKELLSALRAVCDGEAVIDPALLRSLAHPDGVKARGSAPLTRLESDVVRHIASGLTNREIAERMGWSVGNVKKYVQQILEKLEVSDRTQAAAEAVRRGLLG
jgi:DNA-binding NarL/FixJ family response regulator